MLSKETIARAWKDKEFRNSLTEEEQSMLPTHPSGMIELTDEQLGEATGGITYCGCSPTACWCPPPWTSVCGGGGTSLAGRGGCCDLPY